MLFGMHVYVFSHLFYHPSPLLFGVVYALIVSIWQWVSIYGRVYKCVYICAFTNVYAVHFHDIYFMPFFRLNISPYFLFHIHLRAHTYMHFFFLFVCFWAIFRTSYLAIQLEAYVWVWSECICIYLPGLHWKCNYRDFRRKMGGKRDGEKGTHKTSLQVNNNKDYREEKVTCEKECAYVSLFVFII